MNGEKHTGETESAVLGGGCFWCLEAVYKRIPGVKRIDSGYAGGTVENPSYEEVCTGKTGHAEVVKVTYDPEVISYREILDQFWRSHDPTTLNRQGADVGTQYRSVIFYENEEQKKAARESIEEAQKSMYEKKIMTELKPLEAFYEAEEYHRDYYDKHPYAGYCSAVIRPKLKKLALE